jgi:hypothetical protein
MTRKCVCTFHVVGDGGLLFFHFLLTYGTWKTRSMIRTEMQQAKVARIPFVMSNDLLTMCKRLNEGSFYMWILQSLRHRGIDANQQIYYLTSILMFRGFSRRGIEMFSKFSIALPIRTFDSMRQAQIRMEESITRYINNQII